MNFIIYINKICDNNNKINYRQYIAKLPYLCEEVQ